jgi:hypothetical protein
MKNKNHDIELIEILKNKEFKTFWHCLEYLSFAGYESLEAFSYSMKIFGESRIYTDVAFIKLGNNEPSEPMETLIGGLNVSRTNKRYLYVGLIDETNIHLSGMYDFYRKSSNNGSMVVGAIEIEDTCEIIKFDLPRFIIDYLHNLSRTHFGFAGFSLELNNNDILTAFRGDTYSSAGYNTIPVYDNNPPPTLGMHIDENGNPRYRR